MRKEYSKWIDGFNESIAASILIAFIFLCIGLVFTQNFWLGCSLGGFSAVLSFNKLFKNHRESTYKLFFTDVDVTMQNLIDILDKKGIPFEKVKNRFFVDVLTISVIKGQTRYDSNCAKVKIRPNKLVYAPLIKSLQEKLDSQLDSNQAARSL